VTSKTLKFLWSCFKHTWNRCENKR